MKFDTVVFCDLSKAFDCVDHGMLFRKLKKYNFCPKSIHLIQSYLQNRIQAVRISGVLSAESVINIGVPQGSVLVPMRLWYGRSVKEVS